MGVVDKATFAEIKRSGGNIGPFIRMIEGAKAVASMEVILVFFAMFAILSSLLSASLGLCDYFRDLLKNRMAKKNEMLPVLLTYLPPALFCIIKPDGFLLAISYAGIALVIWAVLLPPVLLLVARKRGLAATYHFPLSDNILKLFLMVGTLMWIFMVAEVFIN
ncbi:aromatic amino acid transport family protein [Erwinia sp. E_sp_B01_3]|uniref:aromatic amino acid transport family protein n=2 Tax=Erwinia TaxID=551 RepID=UPI0030D39569